MANQSRSSASASAQRTNNINQLNNIGSQRSEFHLEDTFNAVEICSSEFIQRVKTNINSHPALVNSGQIEDIRLETTGNAVNILINNHLLFQDEGVRGNASSAKAPNSRFTYRDKMPPVEVFRDMIVSRNISLRNEESMGGQPSPFEDLTEDEKITQAAWGMAKNIQKVGFKGYDVYQKEIPSLISDLQSTLTDFTVNFLTQQIVNNNGSRSTIPRR